MARLGQALRQVRHERGWRQVDLAAASGLTQKYISEIESGRVDPRWSVICRLTSALGVSVGHFYVDPSK